MNRFFGILLTLSSASALWQKKTAEAAQSLLASGVDALTLTLTLGGAMMLWGGMMEILRRTGDVERLGRFVCRLLSPLFPGMCDAQAWQAMGINFAANMLGLGNAATPAGVEAAKRLASFGNAGLQALAMLLALNNSCIQWLPTTVIALRGAAGAAQPGDIWGATLLSSGVSTVTAAGLMALLQARDRR